MKFEDITDLTSLTKDDVLSAIGLATRRTATERFVFAAGLVGLGLVVGVGGALLLAPKSGRVLREDLGNRFSKLRHADNSSTNSFESSDSVDEVRT
jgi:YtxH-like protein